MIRRLVVLALAGFAASAQAQGVPSERVCVELRADLDRKLTPGLDTIEINNFLFEAARKGCVDSAERALKAGGSRLARNREGSTPLALAARAGRGPVVVMLLDGAAPEERRQIDMADARGSSPLMLAIHAGRPALAKTLIEAGADVAPANVMGETALSEAAFAGDDETAALLLKKGAKSDTLDRYGKSPICYAAARGRTRQVAALLDAGVGVNARYGGDLTALMWAAGFPDLTRTEDAVATLKLLVERGAKVDLVDDRGRSALSIAAGLNRFETAKALLEAGADRGLKDKAGKSAADLAATEEMRALVK